jgi:branched-chain amino acid transport system substrate-binding protein
MRMTRLRPSSTLGVMYENDDFGKDLVKGLKDGLGDKAASMILKEVSYEVTDPTIDSQIITLAGSGADIFFDASLPKFAAQAIRKRTRQRLPETITPRLLAMQKAPSPFRCGCAATITA